MCVPDSKTSKYIKQNLIEYEAEMHINDMPFANLLPELVQESQGSSLFHKY